VTRGSKNDAWFNANKERIRNAAMGKGAPQDYELALEWAVRSRKIQNVRQRTQADDDVQIVAVSNEFPDWDTPQVTDQRTER
jgi:hypothetical protein